MQLLQQILLLQTQRVPLFVVVCARAWRHGARILPSWRSLRLRRQLRLDDAVPLRVHDQLQLVVGLHLLEFKLVLQIGHARVDQRSPVGLELSIIVFLADLRSLLVQFPLFEAKTVPILLGRAELLLFQLHSSLFDSIAVRSESAPISDIRPNRNRVSLKNDFQFLDSFTTEATRLALLAIGAVLAFLADAFANVLHARIICDLPGADVLLHGIIVFKILVFIFGNRTVRKPLKRISLLPIVPHILFLIHIERILEQFIELNWHFFK